MSKIEWTDETWNPTTGCTKVSPGCANCYIERTPPFRMAGRKFQNGKIPVELHPDRLDKPLKWRKPRRVFVNSLSDLFHEDVPFEFVAKVFAVAAMAPQHTFQILTKRPERAVKFFAWAEEQWPVLFPRCEHEPIDANVVLEFLEDDEAGEQVSTEDFAPLWPLPNVWLGTSVENQQTAHERIPQLLQCPAAVRFLSCEPLLGPVEITRYLGGRSYRCSCGFHSTESELIYLCGDDYRCEECGQRCEIGPTVLWVIAGGESGPGARPCHPDWARSLRDQCVETRVPYFFKQWGEWLAEERPGVEVELSTLAPNQQVAWGDGETTHTLYTRVGKKVAGRLLDGRTWDEFPEST